MLLYTKRKQVPSIRLTTVNTMVELKALTSEHKELLRLCKNSAIPVYLIQLELERYKLQLGSELVQLLSSPKVRKTF